MSGGVDGSSPPRCSCGKATTCTGSPSRSGSTKTRRLRYQSAGKSGGAAKSALRNLWRSVYVFHKVVDRRDVFQRGVIDDFVAGYASGTTPNPQSGAMSV